jgi:hypothetical protein
LKINLLILFTLSLSIVFLAGCLNSSPEYTKVKPVLKKTTLKIDTSICEIKIDSSRLFAYKIFSVSDQGIFCGFNETRKAFDFFDLVNETQLNSAKAETSGPNQIKRLDGMYFHNRDSIFLLTGHSIKVMNSLGEISNSISLNKNKDESSTLFDENEFTNSTLFPNFVYNKTNHTLYFQNNNIVLGSCKSDYYKSAVIGSVNLSTKNKAELLSLSYSPLYQKAYFGFLSDPNISITNSGSIALGFPIEPVVSVYDPVNKDVKSFGSFVNEHSSIANELSWGLCYEDDKKMKHFIESPIYSNLISDPFENLNYRFQLEPITYTNTGKKFSNLGDKRIQLSVMDDQFNILGCLEILDRKTWVLNAFVLKSGIFVSSPRGENTLRFKIFKIKKNEV